MCPIVMLEAAQVVEQCAALEAVQAGDGSRRFGIDELLLS
jgi:hypothetical protein